MEFKRVIPFAGEKQRNAYVEPSKRKSNASRGSCAYSQVKTRYSAVQMNTFTRVTMANVKGKEPMTIGYRWTKSIMSLKMT